MTTYFTGNPIGSVDVKDLYDNAQNLDIAMQTPETTWVDRLGVTRRSWAGATGYDLLGDYAAGIEVTSFNQIIRDPVSGEFWRAAAGTTLPYVTTGDGMPEGGAFVSVGDAALRQQLADTVSPVNGAALVGFSDDLTVADLATPGNVAAGDAMIAVKQPFSGAVARNQHQKNQDHITTADVAAPVSPSNASTAFTQLEASGADSIDLLGKTYSVTGIALTKLYYNGTIIKDGVQVIPPPVLPLSKVSGTPTVGTALVPADFNNRLRAEVAYIDNKFSMGLTYDGLDWGQPGVGQIRYVSSTGSDSNNGTTTALAWKTMTKAFTESLSANLKIHILDRYLHRSLDGHTTGVISIGPNLKIVAAHESGECILGTFEDPSLLSWTKDGVYSDYFAARSQTKSVFDAKFRDARGNPRPLRLVDSLVTARDTPGTWYRSGDDSTIYVHSLDSRVPDSRVLVVLSVGNLSFSQTASGSFSMDGIKILASYPSSDAFRITHGTSPNTASVTLRNCSFLGSYYNGASFVRTNTVFHENCTSAYTGRDGFNYSDGGTPSAMVVYEKNAVAYENGALEYVRDPQPTSSDNASTSHNGMSIMRVNCDYYDAKGGVVADVNGTYSLNYGVRAGGSTAGDSGKASFFFDDVGAVGPKPKYLIGCAGGTDDTVAISAPAGVDVRVQNWQGQLDVYPGTVIRDVDGNVVS